MRKSEYRKTSSGSARRGGVGGKAGLLSSSFRLWVFLLLVGCSLWCDSCLWMGRVGRSPPKTSYVVRCRHARRFLARLI